VFPQRAVRVHALGVLAVLIVVGVVYAQTLGFGFVWDDDQIIYGRIEYQSPSRWLEAVRQPLDFSPNYFRPLALSSLLVQIWIWQANPAPFHAANVLIHLVNTALVCALGLRLLGGRWQGLIAGLLYGVHPALVESVAFVSSRYDLLATLFLLLALWLEGRLQGAARVAGVAVAFLLALLCKEMALTLPLVMLLWQLAVGYPTDAKTPSSKVPPASQGEPPALGSPHAVGGTPRSGGAFLAGVCAGFASPRACALYGAGGCAGRLLRAALRRAGLPVHCATRELANRCGHATPAPALGRAHAGDAGGAGGLPVFQHHARAPLGVADSAQRWLGMGAVGDCPRSCGGRWVERCAVSRAWAGCLGRGWSGCYPC
jgi:hypothetical protein